MVPSAQRPRAPAAPLRHGPPRGRGPGPRHGPARGMDRGVGCRVGLRPWDRGRARGSCCTGCAVAGSRCSWRIPAVRSTGPATPGTGPFRRESPRRARISSPRRRASSRRRRVRPCRRAPDRPRVRPTEGRQGRHGVGGGGRSRARTGAEQPLRPRVAPGIGTCRVVPRGGSRGVVRPGRGPAPHQGCPGAVRRPARGGARARLSGSGTGGHPRIERGRRGRYRRRAGSRRRSGRGRRRRGAGCRAGRPGRRRCHGARGHR